MEVVVEISTIWFIRHAESQSNVGLPTASPESAELTDKGIEQADRIATIFTESPSLLVTSSYIRTKRTAEPTMSRFPWVREEEWPVHEFTYLSSMHEENTTIEDRRPLVDTFWGICDPSYVDGQGSESFEGFIARVQGVIEQLKRTEHDLTAIFSHEQFMHAILWLSWTGPVKISPESMRGFRRFLKLFSVPNGAILRVQFRNSQEPWQCKIITEHLENLESMPLRR
jgi:probable phosphoglycerate mutase